MRDLLLAAIVAMVSLAAIVRPRLGVYGYVWYAVMRPDVLAYVPDSRPYSLIIAVATLIGSLPYLLRVTLWFRNPVTLGLLALVSLFTLSTFAALVPALATPPFQDFIKIILVVMLIPVHITTREHFRWLFLIIAFSMGIHGLRFGAYGILHGGVRFGDGFGGSFDGNNEIAMALVMALPFCWYAIQLVDSRSMRVVFLAMTAGSIAATVMTFSRAGALGLGTILLLLLKGSKHKALTFTAMALMLVPAIYLVQDDYLDRLQTIQTPTEEASANSRLTYWNASPKIWKEHPIFGVGFGQRNEQRILANYVGYDTEQVLHNTFLQVLIDSGTGAFIAFVGLLLGTIIGLYRSARHLLQEEDRETAILPRAVMLSLIGFAICGFFGSRERYDFYYILLMTAAAWYEVRHLSPDEATEEVPELQVEPAVAL